MKKIIYGIILLTLSLEFSGCATNRGRVSLEIPQTKEVVQSNNKNIFINSVMDNRIFELKPSKPSIPSLKYGEIHNKEITSLAIARKRNGFGKAIGDILLKDGKTVSEVIKSSTEQALLEKGYKVIKDKSLVTDKTIIVDINVNQFWTWLNMGFWALTISTEIGTDITIKEATTEKKEIIHLTVSDTFQTGAGRNFIEVMQQGLKAYMLEIKTKF